MHRGKNVSGMSLHSVILVLLMDSKSSEWVPWMIPFSLEKNNQMVQNQVNREFVPGILDTKPNQYRNFSITLIFSVIVFETLSLDIFSWLAATRSVNRRLLHIILSYSLLCEGLPILEQFFTTSHPSLNHLSKTRLILMILYQ